MQQHTFRAMGCRILIALDSDTPLAARHLADVEAWFAGWEQQMSRFCPDSDLSRLNRSAGTPQQVSAPLWDVIQAALEAAAQSNGLVTPVVLNALEAAGYVNSFDSPESSNVAEQHAPATVGDWRDIATDPRTRTVALPAGMRIDLGGIAKGWAAEQAMQRLRSSAPVLVDAGGDSAISGMRANGSRWPIAITNPFAPDTRLDLLMLRGGGVATSGRDYRRWQSGGTWQHHLIDPRTGRPAKTDVWSATVVAPGTRAAEMAAKVVLLLGSRAGLAWLEARPALAGLLVCEDGTVLRSRRLKQFVW